MEHYFPFPKCSKNTANTHGIIASINGALLITLILPSDCLIGYLYRLGQLLNPRMTALPAYLLQEFLLVAEEVEMVGQLVWGVLVVQQHPVVDFVLH